jgi:hypothetical protein
MLIAVSVVCSLILKHYTMAAIFLSIAVFGVLAIGILSTEL